METLLTTNYTGPGRRQKVHSVAEILSTGGLSLMSETGYPTSEEIHEIEEGGFVLDSVQAHLNRLDQGTPNDVRTAAMLRGAFNDLLGKIEQPTNH